VIASGAGCRTGLPGSCEATPPAAMYGVPLGGNWGGLFDDVVRVPHAAAMLHVLPDGLELASVVSASDNQALSVEVLGRRLVERPAARVLILGARSTGLYAVDTARALDAGEVVYADHRPERLELARELGARAVEGPPTSELGEFDIIFDARLNPDWLLAALARLRPEGICESVGPHFEQVSFPLFEMYLRGATYRISRGNPGASIPRLLELIEEGRLHHERVISDVIAWDEAPQALLEHPMKPMFVRESARASRNRVRLRQ
jgi:alcohol dehydrogenase